MIKESANLRIDLLGGTLDLHPINHILGHALTINGAIGLKASVELEATSGDSLVLESADYKKKITLGEKDPGPFKFQSFILDHFGITSAIKLTLSSDSPPGAGLGGSSAMGLALYRALCVHTGQSFQGEKAVKILNAMEATILEAGPAGYQDYYPGIHGGILALRPSFDGVETIQLYSDKLRSILEERLTLVYSGQERSSGVTNWEIYKRFFDGDKTIRSGLEEIARLASLGLRALEDGAPEKMPPLVAQEGLVRRHLFPSIVTPEMDALFGELAQKIPDLGLKVCGAGGGGCFLLVHGPGNRGFIEEKVVAHRMRRLDLKMAPPIN